MREDASASEQGKPRETAIGDEQRTEQNAGNATRDPARELSTTNAPRGAAAKKPDAPPNRGKTKRERRECAQWVVTTTIEAVGVAVLIAYTCFTYGLLSQSVEATKASRTSADAASLAASAAQSAAQTAGKELELSERPWVTLTVETPKPFTFNANGAQFPVTLSLKNVGHSVALNVVTDVKILKGDMARMLSDQWKACEALRHRQNDALTAAGIAQDIIFPNEELRHETSTGLTRDEVDAALRDSTTLMPPMPGMRMMTVMLVACVDYRFPFSGEHHQTRKAFLWVMLPPEAPNGEIKLAMEGAIATAAD